MVSVWWTGFALYAWFVEGESFLIATLIFWAGGLVILWGGYGFGLWILKGYKEDQEEDQPPDS